MVFEGPTAAVPAYLRCAAEQSFIAPKRVAANVDRPLVRDRRVEGKQGFLVKTGDPTGIAGD